MKRKLLRGLLTVMLLASLSLAAWADEIPPLVVDNAGLLTQEEVTDLNFRALELRDYKMDVVILTVDSLGGQRPQDYADDFFDANDYGYGDNYSGVLLLLSMEERDWYISTSGDGSYALTDYGIQASMEDVLPWLGEGEYYLGFAAWLDALPAYFEAFQNGEPIDGYSGGSGSYYHGDQEEAIYYEEETEPSLVLSLLLGLAAAGVSVLVMRSGMNTKRQQRSASSYLDENSFQLRTQRDLFLYSNITKTPRPKNPPPSSGGGSSMHRSSSGRSHGGGGGKF